MPDDLPTLPSEWLDAAQANARNLGLAEELTDLSSEHWQRVLANVEMRMRMLGVDMPDRWREALTDQAGRGERYDGPES